MVTIGKSRSSMGWVVIEVAMGDTCHSLYDLPISTPAPTNPVQTTTNHKIFSDLVYKKRISKEANSVAIGVHNLCHTKRAESKEYLSS